VPTPTADNLLCLACVGTGCNAASGLTRGTPSVAGRVTSRGGVRGRGGGTTSVSSVCTYSIGDFVEGSRGVSTCGYRYGEPKYTISCCCCS
jgi:hypothetical protein